MSFPPAVNCSTEWCLANTHTLVLEFFASPYGFPHLSSSSLCACGNIVALLYHTLLGLGQSLSFPLLRPALSKLTNNFLDCTHFLIKLEACGSVWEPRKWDSRSGEIGCGRIELLFGCSHAHTFAICLDPASCKKKYLVCITPLPGQNKV